MEPQNDTKSNREARQLWVHPWKYAESFIVTLNILVVGFAIEAISGGSGVKTPAFPINLFFIIGLGIFLTIIHVKFKENPVVQWLSGIPAAISVIVVYAILVLLLGFIPQDVEQPSILLKISGLAHVKTSWPFLLLQFYFLIILGFVTLRRAIPFKVKNIGFLLNHLGLWLTILAAGLSSSDLQRYKIYTYENEKETNVGLTDNEEKYTLPFSVKLLDFDIIEYNPKLGIVNLKTGNYVMGKNETRPFAEPNLDINHAGWNIKIVKYLPLAIYKNGVMEATTAASGYPAALVFAKNIITQDTARGWISTGSIYLHQDFLSLKDSLYLILDPPDPKKFYSRLVFYNGTATPDTVQVEVNKAHTIAGWTVYQSGYNEKMRKWSNVSVLETVRDPWLPVVYVGIFMLLAGALYMFWIGKDKKE